MESANLRPMTIAEYEGFLERTSRDFAADSIRAGRVEKEGALARVEEMVRGILPEGMETPGHRFMTMILGDTSVGQLWYQVQGGKAFIFDIYVNGDQRGSGYGTDMLEWLEKRGSEEGFNSIRLHVFGHNTGAIRLYERCGYSVTGMEMEKTLS